jgi:HK97 family phage prohead protease
MPSICKTLAFQEAEIKFVGAGSSVEFQGYASVFGVTDSDGDIFLPGAYKSALSSQQRPVNMYFNHQTRGLPVGKFKGLSEDEKGLFVHGELTNGLTIAKDLEAAMRHGTVQGLSVGVLFTRDDYEPISTGRAFKNVSMLREISIVTEPANPLANLEVVKSLEGVQTIRDAESWLRESAGLSKSEAQAAIACIKSAIRRDSEGQDQIAALLAQLSKSPI